MMFSLKSFAIIAVAGGLTAAGIGTAIVAGEDARSLSERAGGDKLIYITQEHTLLCPKQINSRTYCTTLDGKEVMKPELRD